MPYFPPPSSGGVSDGSKGDILVSGSGATWTLTPTPPTGNETVATGKSRVAYGQYTLAADTLTLSGTGKLILA